MRPRPAAALAIVGAAGVLALAACGASASGGSTASAASTSASSSASAPASGPATLPAPGGVITITSAEVPMPASIPVPAGVQVPQRIVSLATGVGETLAALGIADRVVGRDETSDVPQIHGAEVVTKAHATSAEKVLALQPDLVIADASTSPPEALAQLRDAGVDVVQVPEAWTLADIGPRTRAVAAAVGLPAASADAVVAEATAAAATPAPGAPRVAFLYLRGTAAIYLVGGVGSGADAMISAAGGVDAGAAAGYQGFVPLTAEALARLDPDVLLVMTKGLESVGGIDGLVTLPGVAQTTAGRERRVVAVDDTLLLSFGPRTGALTEALAAALTQAPA